MAELKDIVFDSSDLVQSPFLDLETLGSNGEDGSTAGIHLRWFLEGNLGLNHIPKGNLITQPVYAPNGNVGFNKTNDFVKVYKVAYDRKFEAAIDLINNPIDSIDTSQGKRVWRFDKVLDKIQHTEVMTAVEVRFENVASYDLYATGDLNSQSDRLSFLENYNGVIEVEALDKLAFTASIRVKKQDGVLDTNTQIRMEGISVFENRPFPTQAQQESNYFISYRFTDKFTTPPTTGDPDIPVIDENVILKPSELNAFDFQAPNMKFIRFDTTGCIPAQVVLQTYSDFIAGSSGKEIPWRSVGEEEGYSLSTDQTVVYNRLDNDDFQIDGNWPKFKRETDENELGQENAYKAVTSNYHDIWTNPEGLEYAVKRYLELSTTADNLQAFQQGDEETPDMAFLDGIVFASGDYHAARMLGFGHIDVNVFDENDVEQQYVYLIQYDTENEVEPGFPSIAQNYYMSLPVAASDNIIPEKPVLNDFTFGFAQLDDLVVPLNVADDEGYTKSGKNERFVNINIQEIGVDLEYGPFFFNPNNFTYTEISAAVGYGLEYRGQDNGVWESIYRRPKLTRDSVFKDAVGNFEIHPITNTGNNPIYTHRETEGGWHQYALYSINIFSRPSELSDPKDLFTKFPKKARILPPVNLFAAVIQKEIPLVLSTPRDQQLLSELTGEDKTFIKTVFSLDNTHYANHQLIDKIQFLYRDNLPRVISGRVKSISEDTNGDKSFAIIETEALPILSTGEGEILDPDISDITNQNLLDQKFLGGVLACEEGRFIIEGIEPDEFGKAKVLVRKKALTNMDSGPNDDPLDFQPVQEIVLPKVGDYFTIVENLLTLENWNKNGQPNILTKEIPVKNYEPVSVSFLDPSDVLRGVSSEVKAVQMVLADTDVYVDALPSGVAVNDKLVYNKHYGVKRVTSATSLVLEGDLSLEILTSNTFSFFESDSEANRIDSGTGNTIVYTLSSVEYIEPNDETILTVNESFTDIEVDFASIFISRQAEVLEVDTNANRVRVKNDISEGFMLTHYEITYTEEQIPILNATGGLVDEVEVIPLFDETKLNENDPDTVFIHDGRFAIEFKNKTILDPGDTSLVGQPHYAEGVEYYGGTLRVRLEDTKEPVNFIVEAIHREFQPGQDPYLEIGEITTPLKLIIRDPGFDRQRTTQRLIVNPGEVIDNEGVLEENINTRTAKAVYHPNYLFYIESDPGKIEDDQVFPIGTEEQRLTILGARSVDSYCFDFDDQGNLGDNLGFSPVSQPAQVKAVRIVEPVDPEPPTGPTFATRPDVYVKSTYTMDVAFPSDPYAVIFYRANTSTLLGLLYKEETANSIRQTLDSIDEIYLTDIWQMLTGLEVDDTDPGLFKLHTQANFRFPLPDNGDFIVPSAILDREPLKPFNPDTPLKLDVSITDTETNQTFTILQIVDLVFKNAFVPLQKNPIVYADLKEGTQTSSARPVTRDENDQLLPRSSENFNPSPMAVRLPKSIPPQEGPEIKSVVRFTDYSLDGASNELYFYFAMSMGSQMDFSNRSDVIGPIFLVNSAPARPPVVRKVISQLANPIQEIPTAVKFEIDQYLESERIKSIRIYRTTDLERSFSVRNMELVKSTPVSGNVVDEVLDDFTDRPIPPYGDPLFYRLVAMREIVNEQGLMEEIPSEPTDRVMATIVDVFNPEAPELTFDGDLVAAPSRYINAELTWPKTANNGIYRLFKMTSSGNWSLIQEFRGNLDQFTYEIGELSKVDEDGDEIYHRYKVDVENSSGLLNLQSKEITI